MNVISMDPINIEFNEQEKEELRTRFQNNPEKEYLPIVLPDEYGHGDLRRVVYIHKDNV